MNVAAGPLGAQAQADSGLMALCGVSAYYRIPANPRNCAGNWCCPSGPPILPIWSVPRQLLGLKARWVRKLSKKRLGALRRLRWCACAAAASRSMAARRRTSSIALSTPSRAQARDLSLDELYGAVEPQALLVARKLGGPGITPSAFSFRWFLPSIWRYRKPLAHVLVASFFVQTFALVTPLFFQVIIDKVLSHKGYDTLFVLVGGLAVIGLFDVVLQYLRTYALSHTTNRIDVELGRRLFAHLFHLPMSYFETRAAGQTVARVRELETIRSFLTGQGLFSAIDLFFTFVFIAVLLAYSWKLSLIVLFSIPLYLLIAAIVRPSLREKIKEKFNRGAESQQMLVEAIVGVQTIKAAAIEPAMQTQWEEKLAAYVSSSFDAGLIGAGGSSAIQYVQKLANAALLLFGAKAVIDGDLLVGELVAFSMIAGQVAQPVLRLSQIWQDFQQVQISIDRLGDILNASPEAQNQAALDLPRIRGQIVFRNVTFRYRPGAPDVLKNVSLAIHPGEVLGIVGHSGSGKSTLTKLVQQFYAPNEGQVLVDGIDVNHARPSWLRARSASCCRTICCSTARSTTTSPSPTQR